MDFIKNFVVSSGRFIIDVSASIILIAIFILFLMAFIAGLNGMSGNPYYASWSLVAIIAVPLTLIFFVSCFYFIYMVIDILDTLKKINSNIEENNRLLRNVKADTVNCEENGIMKFARSTQTH